MPNYIATLAYNERRYRELEFRAENDAAAKQ